MKKTKIKTKTKTETIAGEDTYAGALRAPRAGSPACVFVFILVLIYVELEFPKTKLQNLIFEETVSRCR